MNPVNRRQALKLTAAGLAGAASLSTASAAEPGTTTTSNPKQERTKRKSVESFEELPVGSVLPLGWIRAELQKQAEGITGNLTSLYAPFTGNAWTADETSSSTPWVPWEVRAYWCDGAIRCGILLNDSSLIAKATDLLQFTFSHPQADGYLWSGRLEMCQWMRENWTRRAYGTGQEVPA